MYTPQAFMMSASRNKSGDRIGIANAPCSWGVLEHTATQRVGFARTLDEIASTGYMGTELGDWGFMPTEPERLHDELSTRGLLMVGAFVPVALRDERVHADGAERAVRAARLLAAVCEKQRGAPRPYLVLSDDNCADPMRERRAGRIRPEDGLATDEWRTFTRGAERIAREVLDRVGVRTAFHHHAAGFVETPAEVTTLMERTDPELLGLCLDTGHYTFGGGNALEALITYGSRVWHVHFKDCAPHAAEIRDKSGAITGHRSYREALRCDVFCELGRGVVPFPAIIDELRRRDHEGWIVVEQDIVKATQDLAASARRNRAYLTSLGI